MPEKQHTYSDHNHEHNQNHSHEHNHDNSTNKFSIALLIISIFLFGGALLVSNEFVKVIFFASSALFAGYDLFLDGFKMLFKLNFEENVLLLIAVVASFILGEYPEACIVTILFKIGGILERGAIAKSKKSMEKLTQIRPDIATIMSEDNQLVAVEASSVNVGDTIYIRAGDRVPLDCEIVEGGSSVDASALTGESVPISVEIGDSLLSGSVNLSGLLKCKVTKSFENSAASQIIELVYQSSQKKGKAENFITRLAKVYTPIVMALALMLAVIPPMLGIGSFHDFIMRSLIFLVAACPCALVISIPLTFYSSIGAVSKHGVLVKGSMYIEKLSKVSVVALDKTGTLTSGKLSVDKITPLQGFPKQKLASYFSSLESYSTHPIAKAIVFSIENSEKVDFTEVSEIAGLGVIAKLSGQKILCGSKRLLEKNGVSISELPNANVYLAIDAVVVGTVTMKEEIPNSSISLAKELSEIGINRLVMLTGDSSKSAGVVANKCGITEFYSELLPKDKVERVEKLKAEGNNVLFVGDGINDAPVLTTADLGVSMGLGSEIANASSDIVLSSNSLKSLPVAITLAKRSMRVVYFNIAFALSIKILVLILGSFGLASMWLAVFADIGVTMLTVLNSIRILGFSKK